MHLVDPRHLLRVGIAVAAALVASELLRNLVVVEELVLLQSLLVEVTELDPIGCLANLRDLLQVSKRWIANVMLLVLTLQSSQVEMIEMPTNILVCNFLQTRIPTDTDSVLKAVVVIVVWPFVQWRAVDVFVEAAIQQQA